MNRLLATRSAAHAITAGLAIGAALLLGAAFWQAMNQQALADERSTRGEWLNYASPLELLFSPDGTRLYVLCQQTRCVKLRDHQDHRRGPHAARHRALCHG